MRRIVFAGILLAGGLGADYQRPLRLVSDEQHAEFMKFLPPTDDSWLRVLKTKNIIFYTDDEMPPAYQIWDGLLPGIHSVYYNISADKPRERYGNPNLEFPWKGPAGLDSSDNAHSIKFVVLPDDNPILWWREALPHDTHPAGTFRWVYPVGTVFGEILTVRSPAGWDYTFELRTRTRTAKTWVMNVFRPFATPAELIQQIKNVEPGWREDERLVNWFNVGELSVSRLVNEHPKTVIDRRALLDPLPPLQPRAVEKLLTETKFKSVLGQAWRQSAASELECHAPTAEAGFHVVPRNYAGAFLEASSRKCMTCHDTVAKHANDFQFGRDWYGRVRGSDGIFSFHIFEPSCISGNGVSRAPELRTQLIRAGKLRHYDEYRREEKREGGDTSASP
jgi:hypothetical protein